MTDRRGPLVSWARAPVTRNRGGGSHDGNPVELADGGFSGDDDGTYVTASILRVD